MGAVNPEVEEELPVVVINDVGPVDPEESEEDEDLDEDEDEE